MPACRRHLREKRASVSIKNENMDSQRGLAMTILLLKKQKSTAIASGAKWRSTPPLTAWQFPMLTMGFVQNNLEMATHIWIAPFTRLRIDITNMQNPNNHIRETARRVVLASYLKRQRSHNTASLLSPRMR